MTNLITFEDFRNSREYTEDLVDHIDGVDWDASGYIYRVGGSKFYIEHQREADAVVPEVKHDCYVVTIGNESSDFGDGLGAAERYLWEQFAFLNVNCERIQYDAEFGTDYDLDINQVEQLLAAGFEDTSWHNDICPSFTRNLTGEICEDGIDIRFWFDAPSIYHRECGENSPQFCVHFCDVANYDHQPLIETDNFDAAFAVALGLIALPQNEDEWGSERQVDAENEFFEACQRLLSEECYELIEEYGLKATVEERVAYAINKLYRQYHEGAKLPATVFTHDYLSLESA